MKFEFYFIDADAFQHTEYRAVEIGYGEIPAEIIKSTIYTECGFEPIHPDWCDELFTYGGSTFTNGKDYAHVKKIENKIYIYEM